MANVNFLFWYIFVILVVRVSTTRALDLILHTVRIRARLQVKGDRPEVVLEEEEVHGVEAEEVEVEDAEQVRLQPENTWDMKILCEWRICKLNEFQMSRPEFIDWAWKNPISCCRSAWQGTQASSLISSICQHQEMLLHQALQLRVNPLGVCAETAERCPQI